MLRGMDFAPVFHDTPTDRFVLPTDAGEAFVDIVHDGTVWVLPHAEVPVALRGTGAGKALATGTFRLLESMGVTARLTCPYLVAMAKRDPHWAAHFGV